MSMRKLLTYIERDIPDVKGSICWLQLKELIEDEFPELVDICLKTVYKMNSKKGLLRVVVTKENQKTWVMYEVTDSVTPGSRWMVGKTWCLSENIWRDEAQSYSIPSNVRIK